MTERIVDFNDTASMEEEVYLLTAEINHITDQLDENNAWYKSATAARKIKQRHIGDLNKKVSRLNKESRADGKKFLYSAKKILDSDTYKKIWEYSRTLDNNLREKQHGQMG